MSDTETRQNPEDVLASLEAAKAEAALSDGSGSKYLTFVLDGERFAADIAKVREILEVPRVVPLPATPDFLYGAINLRGTAVPVIDLRRKFGMPAAERTVDTRIIILDIDFVEDEPPVMLGALADEVEEVFDLEPGETHEPPRIGTTVKAEHILGMSELHGHFVHILDIDKLFSRKELAEMAD